MFLHAMKWGVASTTMLATMFVVPAVPWATTAPAQSQVSSAPSKKNETVPVVVTNDTTQSVPVTIQGTPTVNATVTGEVGITGTPTVNANVSGSVAISGTPAVSVSGPVGVEVLSNPGITAGYYTATCVFTGPFCQDGTSQQAPPGKAFRIDHVTGQMFNSSSASANVPGRMSVSISTPGFPGGGLSTPLPVPCVMDLFTPTCTANPGIHATAISGIFFQAGQAYTGSARVVVYYTVVDLAP